MGCSNDNTSVNNKFAQDNHFDFPLLSDTDLSVAAKYGAAKAGGAAAKRIAGAEPFFGTLSLNISECPCIVITPLACCAVLIDERGTIVKRYDHISPAEFPAQVLQDIKKDEL